jgi:hypothetical protein
MGATGGGIRMGVAGLGIWDREQAATRSGWGRLVGWIGMGRESKIRVCGGGGEMDLWQAGPYRV